MVRTIRTAKPVGNITDGRRGKLIRFPERAYQSFRARKSVHCRHALLAIPQSNNAPPVVPDMRKIEEKGVDVRMATDMISLAWIDNYDITVLVSSDRDFVPVAEFLETKSIKVIHGKFPPQGTQLTARCWGSTDLIGLRENFRFITPERND